MTQVARREVRLDVAPGLYVLRYVASSESRTAPHAAVRHSEPSDNVVTVVGAPGLEAHSLSSPGTSVVLVVRARSSITIALEALSGFSNLDAKFSLDLLAVAGDGVSASGEQTTAVELDRARLISEGAHLPIEIVAHVSRRGDIGPDAEGWIAGPKSPSAVEGLQIQTHSADVGVAGQFLTGASKQVWSAWMTPGAFIGTRQKAAPITGLRLRLVGAEAHRFELNGEAVFLGSPKLNHRGNEVEFSISGGSDPIVGLRISIVERLQKLVEPPVAKISRVRVFR